MTVDVLGTKYTITESNKVKDDNLNSGDGYCDHSTKQIVIDTFQDSPGSLADLKHIDSRSSDMNWFMHFCLNQDLVLIVGA